MNVFSFTDVLHLLIFQDGGAVEITGSPTEKAILSWGVKVC